MADKDLPELECDVVMKGGITSGVVYPEALLRLKDHYRFRKVGGASAGAIAAGVAAAAEFARTNGATTGGFARVAQLPDEMATHLTDLFQPAPALAPLNRVFVAISTKKLAAVLSAVLRGYWAWLIGALVLGLVSGWLASRFGHAGFKLSLIIGLIAFLLSAIPLLAFGLLREIVVALPANDFGLCPGPTQAGASFDGLSDWIARVIEEAAGRPITASAPLKGRRPLMFGELEGAGITLKMMTTNLTLGLGHVLPLLDDKNYWWLETEMRRVMPGWIVDHMVKVTTADETSSLRPFPPADELPVAVGIRMSLSFPGLISAVRLHRLDFPGDRPEGTPATEQLVLFSDGGISSNFPVQFFDTLFPGRPTFGISLDDFDDTRKPPREVYLPMSAGSGRWFPIANRIKSLTSFVMAIINTAKDWQDRRLGVLSGYRERIVHIFLKPEQGGLNLKMEPAVITQLGNYGDRAGALMLGAPVSGDTDPFDLNDHQWRRFLVAYYQVEQLLEEMRGKWGSVGTPGSFAALMQHTLADPTSYKGSTIQWRNDIWNRMDKLMTFSGETFTPPLRDSPSGAIPRHRARLQIVPEA